MSLQSLIKKIKLSISEEADVKLTDVKTVDGVILNFEGDLAVGIEIFIVDETGKNPAIDGEYVLEDGTKLEVAGGKVEAIEAPAEPIEAPEDMPAEMPAMPTDAPVAMAEVKTKDGLSLTFDGELAIGVDIFVVDDAGVKSPAADGEYVLEDGSKLMVKDGKVENVEAVVAAEALSIEELSSMVTKLQEENVQIREILELLAESFSKNKLQEDIKMSMVKPVQPKVELEKTFKNQSTLNNIFKNMYK